MTTLEGQTALVTGAARRIGSSVAAALHAAGARVVIHYRRSATDAIALVAELNDVRADSALAVRADLLDSAALPGVVNAAVEWTGRLDILINNASSFYPTPIGQIDEKAWDDLVGTNLKAPLFLAQAAAQELALRHGCIVNIIDIHAQRPLRDHVVYGSAKAGLHMLTRALAKDLAPDVRVNGVAPGAILWPENGISEQVRGLILGQVPLGRSGSPLDIAGCVLYLVRDADYITGQIIAVDGGRSIGW